jgi:hypothetical protein
MKHGVFRLVGLISLVCTIWAGAPSVLCAEGSDFFSCADRDGRITITNRHYDESSYTCTPFTKLNRSFRQAEAKEKASPSARRQVPAVKERTETSSAAALEAARISAESARTAMEAAQIAAQSARYTAETVAAFAPPFQIIRER